MNSIQTRYSDKSIGIMVTDCWDVVDYVRHIERCATRTVTAPVILPAVDHRGQCVALTVYSRPSDTFASYFIYGA